MLFEGVKLMVVGMTTVMLFLCLMILFITLVSYLTRGSAAREVEAIAAERALQLLKRKKTKEDSSQSADEDIAVITAAVAAYESERFAKA
ncbi:OadG family protein [Desulfopila sp. IMCC35006]|uniref:OadG family protein n=1 Tax=Desulfopila sp. IMCC35006 TaxID=2569542 RepID=UPI00142EC2F2|nr:OadG family protein [Desulfopila sp. IMCC35006]